HPPHTSTHPHRLSTHVYTCPDPCRSNPRTYPRNASQSISHPPVPAGQTVPHRYPTSPHVRQMIAGCHSACRSVELLEEWNCILPNRDRGQSRKRPSSGLLGGWWE